MRALALIIGNSNYEVGELITPVNDANDLANKLKVFGFIVKPLVNIDLDQFNEAVDTFGKELNNYDIGLFYFAGHGMQIEGDNFLTATNTNFETEVSVKYSSITIYKILDYMHKAKNETNILILDACRNNPFEKKWSRSPRQSGLAPIHAPKGTFIAFATSPGEVASNGIDRNGLFTHCLLRHLDDPKVQIEELFKRVRNSVFTFSQGKQTTWEHTSLTGHFIFNSGRYIQASSTEYPLEAIADKHYVLRDNKVDNIIRDLKSYNWYTQSPAINELNSLDPSKVEKEKLFVIGRNILQAAKGKERSAGAFLDGIEKNIKIFNHDGQNHVLNGILFEIYFDSEGRFRGNRLKKAYFDKIISLSIDDELSSSFIFIQQQLQPFYDELVFIPSPEENPVSVELVLDKIERENIVEYKVKGLIYKGKELLNEEEDTWFHRNDGDTAYEPYTYSRFKQFIANQLGVPENLLVLTPNFSLEDHSKVLYPFGYVLSTN